MANKKSNGQDGKMHKVMHEYKEGDLRSSSGAKVKNRKQAIAIGLSESRHSGRDNGRSTSSSRQRGNQGMRNSS
jgi:hypothetical protein